MYTLPVQARASYRPDIDGLRAIAILLVLFYHLKMPIASAGFLGVDIFLVISGYLITSHILSAVETKQFSFGKFYLRRARRILPALITVLILTSITGYFLLLKPDLKNYTNSLLSSILSFSNLYFWKFIHVGYFSTDSTILPLLHTWSLGVEEQFYLIWPILLIFSLYFVKEKPSILVIFLTITAFFTYYLFRYDSSLTYYSPGSRAFELLLGATLASTPNKLPEMLKSQKFSHIISIAALLTIFYSTCVLTPTDYPGLAVLLPVIGTAILIYTGGQDAIANKLISIKPLVYIGLISYSLYLWHWPIIAFSNYLGQPISITRDIIIIALAITLSHITLKFIEYPLRFRFTFNLKKTFFLFIGAPLLISVIFYSFVNYDPNFYFNSISPTASQAIKNQYYGSIKPSFGCHNSQKEPYRLGDFNKCLIGDLTQKVKANVLVTGDSHAMADTGMLDIFLQQAHLKSYIATQSSGPFLLVNLTEPKRLIKVISQRNKVIKQLIHANHYKYVVIAGDWTAPGYTFKTKDTKDKSEVIKLGLTNDITYIIKHKAIPVIILDVPRPLNIAIDCGTTRISLRHCFTPFNLDVKTQKRTRDVILSLKKKFPKLVLVDPSRIICDHSRCYTIINKTPLYFTGHLNGHLNYAGSALIGNLYLKKYGNPFKSSYHYEPISYSYG